MDYGSKYLLNSLLPLNRSLKCNLAAPSVKLILRRLTSIKSFLFFFSTILKSNFKFARASATKSDQ